MSLRPRRREDDEMSDSGHAWLGRIPSGWACLPNRSIFREIENPGHVDEDLLSITIARGVIRQTDLLTMSSKKDSSNLDKAKYKLVEPGDIAYNKMRAWQGAIGASSYRGIVSPAYIVQRLRGDGEPRYFHHLFRTPAFATEAERWSYGITSDQWSLRPEHFKMIYGCVPPVDEQKQIVHFVDYLDSRVRHLVSAKRREIELLTEHKDVLISRAVTGGIQPTRSTRHSGLTWVPPIPDGWEVTALRRHWTVTDCKHLTVPFLDEGIPLVSVREANQFDLDLSKAKRTSTDWYEHLIQGGRQPRRGDVIYCRNVNVGAACFVDTDVDFAMGQDVCLIRSALQNNRFLNYVLHSAFMRQQLRMLQVGSTFSRINVAAVKALLVPVPPRAEQDAIVEHLDHARRELDAPIARTLEEIELIQEYRTGIVSAVVTGALDVRTLAAQLPELPPEPTFDAPLSDDLDLESADAVPEFEEVPA